MHIYVFIHILTSQRQFKNQHYLTKCVEWFMGNQHLNCWDQGLDFGLLSGTPTTL